jgi:hypothetical protein
MQRRDRQRVEPLEAILDRFDAAHPVAARPRSEPPLDAEVLRRYVLRSIVLPVLSGACAMLQERGHHTRVWERGGRSGPVTIGLSLTPRGVQDPEARSDLVFTESKDKIACQRSACAPQPARWSGQNALPVSVFYHPSQLTEDVARWELTNFVRVVLERS